jgi:hypothetical protein
MPLAPPCTLGLPLPCGASVHPEARSEKPLALQDALATRKGLEMSLRAAVGASTEVRTEPGSGERYPEYTAMPPCEHGRAAEEPFAGAAVRDPRAYRASGHAVTPS